MSPRNRAIILLLIACAAPAAPGDILYLRDGSRYYGELIRRNRAEVVFRVATDESGSSMVRQFSATEVVGVRKTGRRAAPTTLAPTNNRSVYGIDDFDQMLREAFELVDDGQLTGALLALQKVVREAPAGQLVELDQRTRDSRGRSLADLLALVRIRHAVERKSGGLFDLRSPTRYESPALRARLQTMIADLMAQPIDGRSLLEWTEQPNEYTRVGTEARVMVRQARLAGAMIGARLKLDRANLESREQRAQLARTRGKLTRLAAHVSALPGFTEMPTRRAYDDPTHAAAERILEAERERQDELSTAVTSQPSQDRDAAEPASQPTEPSQSHEDDT